MAFRRKGGDILFNLDINNETKDSYKDEGVEFLLRWNQDKRHWKVKNSYLHAYIWQSKEDPLECEHKVVWHHPKYGPWDLHMWLFSFEIFIQEEILVMRNGREVGFPEVKNNDIRSFA